jgi:hypothetical protein
MVGGRARDLISSASCLTSASVGPLGFSGSGRAADAPERAVHAPPLQNTVESASQLYRFP